MDGSFFSFVENDQRWEKNRGHHGTEQKNNGDTAYKRNNVPQTKLYTYTKSAVEITGPTGGFLSSDYYMRPWRDKPRTGRNGESDKNMTWNVCQFFRLFDAKDACTVRSRFSLVYLKVVGTRRLERPVLAPRGCLFWQYEARNGELVGDGTGIDHNRPGYLITIEENITINYVKIFQALKF